MFEQSKQPKTIATICTTDTTDTIHYVKLILKKKLLNLFDTDAETYPSTIGLGDTRVLDTENRVCDEVSIDTEWWVWAHEYIKLVIVDSFNFNDLLFNEEKLLKYRVGSFFKEHVDRNDSIPGHHFIGTLLLIRYTPGSSGGVLSGGGESVAPTDITDGIAALAFVPRGLLHEFSVLTEGELHVLKVRVHAPGKAPDETSVESSTEDSSIDGPVPRAFTAVTD